MRAIAFSACGCSDTSSVKNIDRFSRIPWIFNKFCVFEKRSFALFDSLICGYCVVMIVLVIVCLYNAQDVLPFLQIIWSYFTFSSVFSSSRSVVVKNTARIYKLLQILLAFPKTERFIFSNLCALCSHDFFSCCSSPLFVHNKYIVLFYVVKLHFSCVSSLNVSSYVFSLNARQPLL